MAISCTAFDDEAQTIRTNLTGYTVTAHMKAPFRAEIELTVSVTDAANGEFELQATDTATESWFPTVYAADIQFVDGSGETQSSETFLLEVVKDYT